MFKQLFCKHNYKKYIMESWWWQSEGYNTLETWIMKCSKCGKLKLKVIEKERKK